MKKRLLETAKQFLKFGCIGVSNTLISMAVYYIVIFINIKLYLLGNALGFIISTFNAYFWNNRFVFKKRKDEKDIYVIIKTYLVYGFSLALSTGLLYLWVDVLSISEFIAPILNLIITVPLNFCLNKFLVYGKEKNETIKKEDTK